MTSTPGTWHRRPATGATCPPALPRQSDANQRARWLRGACEQFRATSAARLPADDCQQTDTSALPVTQAPGLRCPTSRPARAATRPALRADPGSRIVRARSIVPAAAGQAPRDLLADT
jgi:hypothetical protein